MVEVCEVVQLAVGQKVVVKKCLWEVWMRLTGFDAEKRA